MPSKRPMKSHQDYLRLVCFFCHSKSVKRGRSRYLSSNQKSYIKEKLFPQFDEKIMPTGCCNNCNATISDMIANPKSPRRLPTQDYMETYRKLLAIPISTRSNPVCHCFICQIAKENCVKPKEESDKKEEVKYEICDYCYAQKIPGKHRNCTRRERISNLMENLTPRTRTQLALETAREQQTKKESMSPIRVSRVTGGPSVELSVGKNSSKKDKKL